MSTQKPDMREFAYRHPVILQAIIKIWFASSRGLGVMYMDEFNPILIVCLAFVLTCVSLPTIYDQDLTNCVDPVLPRGVEVWFVDPHQLHG
jgi:hypothetical protein